MPKNEIRIPKAYTDDEREKIVQYIRDKNMYFNIKSIRQWKEMAKAQICPGRSWQSLQQHFLMNIIKCLNSFNISSQEISNIHYGYTKTNRHHEQLNSRKRPISDVIENEAALVNTLQTSKKAKFTDAEINSIYNNTTNQRNEPTENILNNHRNMTSHPLNPPYSEEEDKQIIIFFKENMNWMDLKYNDQLYQTLQIKYSFKRSTKSLRERFLNNILPNLYKYSYLNLLEMINFYDRADMDVPEELVKIINKYIQEKTKQPPSTQNSYLSENNNMQVAIVDESHEDVEFDNFDFSESTLNEQLINITDNISQDCDNNTVTVAFKNSATNTPVFLKEDKSTQVSTLEEVDRCRFFSLSNYIGVNYSDIQYAFISNSEKNVDSVKNQIEKDYKILKKNIHILSNKDYEIIYEFMQMNKKYEDSVSSIIQQYIGHKQLIYNHDQKKKRHFCESKTKKGVLNSSGKTNISHVNLRKERQTNAQYSKSINYGKEISLSCNKVIPPLIHERNNEETRQEYILGYTENMCKPNDFEALEAERNMSIVDDENYYDAASNLNSSISNHLTNSPEFRKNETTNSDTSMKSDFSSNSILDSLLFDAKREPSPELSTDSMCSINEQNDITTLSFSSFSPRETIANAIDNAISNINLNSTFESADDNVCVCCDNQTKQKTDIQFQVPDIKEPLENISLDVTSPYFETEKPLSPAQNKSSDNINEVLIKQELLFKHIRELIPNKDIDIVPFNVNKQIETIHIKDEPDEVIFEFIDTGNSNSNNSLLSKVVDNDKLKNLPQTSNDKFLVVNYFDNTNSSK